MHACGKLPIIQLSTFRLNKEYIYIYTPGMGHGDPLTIRYYLIIIIELDNPLLVKIPPTGGSGNFNT